LKLIIYFNILLEAVYSKVSYLVIVVFADSFIMKHACVWNVCVQFKTKMQIQIIRAKSGGSVQYRNVFHAGWCILQGYGLRGVYQGLGATMLRDTPAFGIYFGSYCLHFLSNFVICERQMK